MNQMLKEKEKEKKEKRKEGYLKGELAGFEQGGRAGAEMVPQSRLLLGSELSWHF